MPDIDILEELSKDEVYTLFLTDTFDVKTVTSSAVQLVAVTEHLAKLSAGISQLDKELHQQVTSHYAELLSQATGIETLEDVLNSVHLKIEALLESAERLKHAVLIPYDAVSSQTAMLVRLQMTCDLLRRTIRIIQLSKRLESQLTGKSSDMVKAAYSLNELKYLTDGANFNGLHVIEAHLQLERDAREQIYNYANELLLKDIEKQDSMNVGIAIQIFCSLHVLGPVLREVLVNVKEKITKKVRQSLDVRCLSYQAMDGSQKTYGPGRAAIPLTGNTAAFRTSLWANMEGLMKSILEAFQQIQLLQSNLEKKKNIILRSPNCADQLEMCEERGMVWKLWESITKILTEEFSHAASESTYIKQAFEVEFPKLLCMFNTFLKGLYDIGFDVRSNIHCSESEIISNSVREAMKISSASSKAEEALRNALLPFENAYLSRCLSRLADSVNVIYSGDEQNVPTTEDINRILRAFKSELVAASIDSVLLCKVARHLSETINFFVEKCQYLACTDTTLIQITDSPNPSQVINSQLVHLLFFFQTGIINILNESQCNVEVIIVVKQALQSVENLIQIVIEPLILSVKLGIKAIIMTMHKEDFSQQFPEACLKSEVSCSLYMKELETFVIRTQSNYFSLYPDCDAMLNGIKSLASCAVEFFVRHASLIRPVGDGGKMKLAADCAQMEMAISPWCQKIGDLGRIHRLLRSFRPLLFQTINHIALSPAIGDIISYSLVINLLFSRAPPELKSPHEVAGMTLEEYSRWMDDHILEKERLVMIKGSLEKYLNWVKKRQDKEFCSVYPIMVKLLQKGMESF